MIKRKYYELFRPEAVESWVQVFYHSPGTSIINSHEDRRNFLCVLCEFSAKD